ncbi:MAG: hypothetical protein ABMA26_06200 [Limisphaerales bacterium]
MNNDTITPPLAKQAMTHTDTLEVNYALQVRGREHQLCDISGKVDMPYALAAEARRNTGTDFVHLMELLLLRPALMQVSGFVNDLRRADVDARESAPSGDAAPGDEPQQHASLASLASLNGAMPEAVDPPLPPNMSPDAPATVLIA